MFDDCEAIKQTIFRLSVVQASMQYYLTRTVKSSAKVKLKQTVFKSSLFALQYFGISVLLCMLL